MPERGAHRGGHTEYSNPFDDQVAEQRGRTPMPEQNSDHAKTVQRSGKKGVVGIAATEFKSPPEMLDIVQSLRGSPEVADLIQEKEPEFAVPSIVRESLEYIPLETETAPGQSIESVAAGEIQPVSGGDAFVFTVAPSEKHKALKSIETETLAGILRDLRRTPPKEQPTEESSADPRRHLPGFSEHGWRLQLDTLPAEGSTLGEHIDQPRRNLAFGVLRKNITNVRDDEMRELRNREFGKKNTELPNPKNRQAYRDAKITDYASELEAEIPPIIAGVMFREPIPMQGSAIEEDVKRLREKLDWPNEPEAFTRLFQERAANIPWKSLPEKPAPQNDAEALQALQREHRYWAHVMDESSEEMRRNKAPKPARRAGGPARHIEETRPVVPPTVPMNAYAASIREAQRLQEYTTAEEKYKYAAAVLKKIISVENQIQESRDLQKKLLPLSQEISNARATLPDEKLKEYLTALRLQHTDLSASERSVIADMQRSAFLPDTDAVGEVALTDLPKQSRKQVEAAHIGLERARPDVARALIEDLSREERTVLFQELQRQNQRIPKTLLTLFSVQSFAQSEAEPALYDFVDAPLPKQEEQAVTRLMKEIPGVSQTAEGEIDALVAPLSEHGKQVLAARLLRRQLVPRKTIDRILMRGVVMIDGVPGEAVDALIVRKDGRVEPLTPSEKSKEGGPIKLYSETATVFPGDRLMVRQRMAGESADMVINSLHADASEAKDIKTLSQKLSGKKKPAHLLMEFG